MKIFYEDTFLSDDLVRRKYFVAEGEKLTALNLCPLRSFTMERVRQSVEMKLHLQPLRSTPYTPEEVDELWANFNTNNEWVNYVRK